MEISLQQTIELLVHEVEANVKRTRVLFSCYHQKSPVNLEKAVDPFRLSGSQMRRCGCCMKDMEITGLIQNAYWWIVQRS